MKMVGLLGGMSWQSSLLYYQLINQGINQKLGKMHSARILLYSLDFEPMEVAQHDGDWDSTEKMLLEGVKSLEAGGADFIVICTNTMHKLFDNLQARTDKPIIHIADATANTLKAKGIGKVGLLGTRFTMEQDFYRARLEEHGLKVVIPDELERELVHNVIYSELCQGIIKPQSRQRYLDIVAELSKNGAEAVILGCTEIGMLIKDGDSAIPLLDTTQIHASMATELMLS